ncbi:MAG: acyl--CoA ligase [Rhodospirillales bacterium]|nr:acyl--CoA ligase [Rhodospirillales bacterium]
MLLIHEMLAKTARDQPDKEAITCRGRRISFSELEEASTKIADFLISTGVKKGMRIAIFSSKCIDEVAVIFGIAKAGCVLVHINPSFRDEKLQHVLAECEPAALFFHQSKKSTIERTKQIGVLPSLLICLAQSAEQVLSLPTYNLETILKKPYDAAQHRISTTIDGDDLAAILYTSGTTASAKGITVTHRILSESTLVSARVLENKTTDRIISVTPFSFDGALSQLFTTVFVGGTLILQDSHFPKDIIKTLISEKITGIHAVPSFWLMILERCPSFADFEFPHLRYVSLIGEAFPKDALAKLKSTLHSTEFFMMYGTTEAFRSTFLAPCDFDVKTSSVGKPLPGVEITIIDKNGNSCRAGEVGEIVHKGAFVSPGYWKRDGGVTFRGGKVYTGDLGMFDEDGYLYFVGRKDTMIKRLGFQVYPEEIEACLQSLDGIATAATVCVPKPSGGHQLNAFLVRDQGSDVALDVVKKHCKQHLPYYMMPDSITFRPSMPKTGTYKVDRAQLLTEASP